MKKTLFISLLLLITALKATCQKHAVSGYITDKETRETLIGVTVFIKETRQGAITDKNGYFSLLNLSNGDYTFQFSYLGYKKLEKTVNVRDKSILLSEIQLTQDNIELKDVTVVGIRSDSVGDRGFETSQLKMTPSIMKNIPSARGDIFKAIKFLPGIEAADPFSPLYSVRGGDPSGNLVLLDGVTVYNPYHLATADGLFNTQSIKDIDIFVGGFGADYGGRNSSILYITTKDGNMNKLHGEVSPTTTHSKVFFEFPVGKEGSMMVAGRYFYNLPMRFVLGDKSFFYDANISYTNRLGDKNRLTVKLFDSFDKSSINFDRYFSFLDKSFNTDIYEDMHMWNSNRWSNRIATAYLKTIINPNIYLKTQVYGSFHSASMFSKMDFRYTLDSLSTPFQISNSSRFASKINDICAKSALTIKTDTVNTFNIGVELNSYYFRNEAEIQHINNGISFRQPSLLAAYAEDKIRLGKLTFRPGLRMSMYSYNNKWEYEPRLNLSYDLPAGLKLKAAWGVYYQYIISMNTQEYEISQFLDYYYPLKGNPPSKSIHYIAGIEKNIGTNSVLSVTGYSIDMPVTYMFNLNLDQLQASTFSDKLEQGTGKALGFEVMWKGEYKNISGWFSYGLSKATRSYLFVNKGKPFLSDFDRTHSFKAVLSYKVNDDLTYNTSLVVQSGLPKTLETTMQNYYFYDPASGTVSSYPFGVENGKNNARLPMVIDWDLGVVKRIRKGFGAELAEFLRADKSYLNVTIGNILFLHRNVLWYFPYGGKKYIPIGMNYLPTVSIGYVIKF